MLKENSLYYNKKNTNNALSITKGEFLADDALIKDAFWMNLLGFLSLYQSHPGDNRLFLYFKQLDKARIAEINDESHDLAIAVKAMADKNFVNMTFTNEFTKFLFILKTKNDIVIKDDLIRAMLAKTPLNNMRGSPIVMQQVVLPFMEKKSGLDVMAATIFPLARTKKTCADFQRIYMLMKNIAKTNDPAPAPSTGQVLSKAAALVDKKVDVVVPPPPPPKTNWEISVEATKKSFKESNTYMGGQVFGNCFAPLSIVVFAILDKTQQDYEAVFLKDFPSSEQSRLKLNLLKTMYNFCSRQSFNGFGQAFDSRTASGPMTYMNGEKQPAFVDVTYNSGGVASKDDEKVIKWMLAYFDSTKYTVVQDMMLSLLKAGSDGRFLFRWTEDLLIKILTLWPNPAGNFANRLGEQIIRRISADNMTYSSTLLNEIVDKGYFKHRSDTAMKVLLALLAKADTAQKALLKTAFADVTINKNMADMLKYNAEDEKYPIVKFYHDGTFAKIGIEIPFSPIEKKKMGIAVSDEEFVRELLSLRNYERMKNAGYTSYKVLREKLGDDLARKLVKEDVKTQDYYNRKYFWTFLLQDPQENIFKDTAFFDGPDMVESYIFSYLEMKWRSLDTHVDRKDFTAFVDFMQVFLMDKHNVLKKIHKYLVEDDIKTLEIEDEEIISMLDVIYSKVGTWFAIEGELAVGNSYRSTFKTKIAFKNPIYRIAWMLYFEKKYPESNAAVNAWFVRLVKRLRDLSVPITDDEKNYAIEKVIPREVEHILKDSHGLYGAFIGSILDDPVTPSSAQLEMLEAGLSELEKVGKHVGPDDLQFVRHGAEILKMYSEKKALVNMPQIKESFKRVLHLSDKMKERFLVGRKVDDFLSFYELGEELGYDKKMLKEKLLVSYRNQHDDEFYTERNNTLLANHSDPDLYTTCLEDRTYSWSNISRFQKLIQQTAIDEFYISLKNNTKLTEPERQKYFARAIDSMKTNNKGSSRLGKVIDHVLQSSLLLKNISGIHSSSLIPFETKVEPSAMTQILKFNSFEINFKNAGIKPYRDESVDYFSNIKKYENVSVAVPPPRVKKVSATEEDLERASLELFSKCNGRHGDCAPWVLDIFEIDLMNDELKQWMEERKDTMMSPLFHGTGSIAANMILRFGFKILQSAVGGVAVTGKMLGDGIYTSPVIDKALQYMGDSGYSRNHNMIGYILEMDAYVGTSGVDYKAAGTGNDSIRSEEYCIKNPRKQLHLKKAYRVMNVPTLKLKGIKEKYAGPVPTVKTEGFKSFFKENRGDIYTVNYIFFDGTIPFRGKAIPFDEFAQRFAGDDRIGLDFGQLGPEIWIKTDIEPISITSYIPDTEELIRDNPDGLYTYWNAIVENL